MEDRKQKYVTSSEHKFFNGDDSKYNEQKDSIQQIPGPSTRIFKNIKSRMQQHLINMQVTYIYQIIYYYCLYTNNLYPFQKLQIKHLYCCLCCSVVVIVIFVIYRIHHKQWDIKNL